jgi:hypothetical protein
MTCPSSPGCGSCPQTTTEPIVIHHNHRTLVALAAISLAGCDALTDDDYRGEAVLSLTGTVDSQGAVAPPGDVNIYLVWHDTVDTPKTAVQLDVRSVFPATFQLNMFTLPPIDPPYEDFSGGEPDILRAARLNSAHIIADPGSSESIRAISSSMCPTAYPRIRSPRLPCTARSIPAFT